MKPRFTTYSVGITGNIGSGKTEVCNVFRALGARVIHADDLAKEIIAGDAGVRKKIRQTFGPEVFSPEGALDRKRMAHIVFSDQKEKLRLEAIVHPPTLQRIDAEISSAKKSGSHPLIVVEAALLFESGADRLMDFIIVVQSEEADAINRVMRRDGISRADARLRLESQMPEAEKAELADFTIRNSGDLSALQEKSKFFFSLITRMSPPTENVDE
ncbi:MAG TPA: dephospho-CoA kinase [Bacteroidota bacterium]|nr:dephospho-CoA kinase [Bacteroidota bacterium]